MKITNTLFALSLIVLSCACSTTSTQEAPEEVTAEAVAIKFPERAKDMNIYEVNIRQYTPEGTFQAFIPHLARLKSMGVDILWIMPIQPIGVEKRKGDLGSYYSIKDYTAVNPEHGTMDDFKAMVDEAHKLDMLVILDWVANHTAWDHHWMTEQPDFFTKDSLGNAMSPVEDWADVVDLNYENQDLHTAMIEEMKFWVTEADLDGFRCDVAHMVPMEFWNKAKTELDKVKDLFMLAEADESEMHEDAFHMTYGWDFHSVMNEIAKGNFVADSIQAYLDRDSKKYKKEDFRMHFTSNHDENSWNGTVKERMGDGTRTFAVLSATLQGMPLIYSGQEAGLDHRLSFFGKDSIDWSELPLENFYKKLITLKKENPALWSGEFGGEVKRIDSAEDSKFVYAFTRKKGDNSVTVVLNLSGETQTADLSLRGTFEDVFSGKKVDTTKEINLDAWEYLVFTSNG